MKRYHLSYTIGVNVATDDPDVATTALQAAIDDSGLLPVLVLQLMHVCGAHFPVVQFRSAVGAQASPPVELPTLFSLPFHEETS